MTRLKQSLNFFGDFLEREARARKAFVRVRQELPLRASTDATDVTDEGDRANEARRSRSSVLAAAQGASMAGALAQAAGGLFRQPPPPKTLSRP